MTNPPFESDLAEVLSAAGSTHHEYEQTALNGVRDELWAGFYAAFVLGRLGDFTRGEHAGGPSRRGRRDVELVRGRGRARDDHVGRAIGHDRANRHRRLRPQTL